MTSKLAEIINRNEATILAEWIREQLVPGVIRPGLLREGDLRGECQEFLKLFVEAAKTSVTDPNAPAYKPVKDMLGSLSRSRGERGFSPSETAIFVFSFKKPVMALLRKEFEGNAPAMAEETWILTEILDKLGLHTTEVYQKSREEVITRQQQDMLELSTPVVKLWDGILALPLIGTLDSNRTQIVMETLLQRVVETGSEVAIIDITGVPTVDTLVAQHLMKTVAAARLMGVQCIISGIRPQIAQTIVHLAVDLGDVITKASLGEAFRVALAKTGATLVKNAPRVERADKGGI